MGMIHLAQSLGRPLAAPLGAYLLKEGLSSNKLYIRVHWPDLKDSFCTTVFYGDTIKAAVEAPMVSNETSLSINRGLKGFERTE